MDYIIKFAEGFRNLFDTGAETFISWMTGIVPVVLLLLVAMNTIIQLIGENRINRLAGFFQKSIIKIFSFAIIRDIYVR